MEGWEILDRMRDFAGNDALSEYDEINDAYETILRRAGLWISRVRDESSVEFADDKNLYDLPMDLIRRLEAVWIKDNQDFQEWRRLDEATEDQFESTVFQFRKSDGTNQKNVPRFYRLAMGATNQLEVTPTPDGTYPCRLVYIGSPTPLAQFVTPILPENYHRVIAKLAAADWLDVHGVDEVQLARAAKLHGQVREAYFPLAVDISTNRVGVARPKQKIMRS